MKLCLVLVLLCLTKMISSHTLDMGTCSCACSDDQDNQAPLGVGRGLAGPPGKRGPLGEAGPPGPQGVDGPPGKGMNSVLGNAMFPARSCNHLFRENITESGVYFVQPKQHSAIFQVYCDFDTPDSQGWTLVASVHENDLNGKCTVGDKWSSEQGNKTATSGESNAWQNLETFGNIASLTSQDYKNPAYFELEASNIMIWHVPNDTPLESIAGRAEFKYKTTNGFLNGSLQKLYSDRYPLVKGPERSTGAVVEKLMHAVTGNAAAIAARISDFKEYAYDCNPNSNNCINDGGGDIYDDGNKLQYAVDDVSSLSDFITYGQKYFEDGVQILSWKDGHPFTFLAWVGQSTVDSFALKVTSNLGADGGGSVTTYSSQLTIGQLQLVYKANHVYGANDPSCAQVFFYVTSDTWNSQAPSAYSTPEWETSETQNLNDKFVVTGPMRNMLIGYVLLAKTTDAQITSTEIANALREAVSNVLAVDISANVECSDDTNSLTVPVTFVQSDSETMRREIPRDEAANFQPGFIHFRPYNSDGLPNAFCPGTRSTGCQPHKMCVGGINSYPYKKGEQCGDFGKRIGRSDSSLLIFYGP